MKAPRNRHAIWLVTVAALGLGGAACGRDPLQVVRERDAAAGEAGGKAEDAQIAEDARTAREDAGGAEASTGPQLPVDGKCPAGLSPCGRGEALRCYDLGRTPEHCGVCGQACLPGIACQAGACQQRPCTGALTFKQLPVASNPTGISYGSALGDYDGDGVVDVVGVPDSNGAMSLLYGAGDGTFPTRQVIETSSRQWGVIAGDVDGDGLLDLTSMSSSSPPVVSADPAATVLTVRRGLGARGAPFEAPTVYPTGPGLVSSVLADFDADGRPDLVSGVRAGLEVRLGRADGHFAPATTLASKDAQVGSIDLFLPLATLATDWNGDHLLDLVYAARSVSSGTGLHFRLGRGDGTFEAEVVCALQMGAVGDVDHDGRPDLISGPDLVLGLDTCNPKRSVALADWPESTRAAFADLDGDGNLDVVADAKVTVRLGDGKGGFPRTVSLPGVGASAQSSGAFLFGDLDRDGRLDVVYSQWSGWTVFLNTCK